MDKLSEEQRTALTKTATERLRAKLVQAGYDEEEVFSIERPALLEAMAKVLVQGLTIGGKPASDPDKDRREKELKLREEELEFKKLEEKRRIEEKEIEESRWKEEIDLHRMELDRQRKLDAAKANDDSSLVGRTRKFAEAIKHVFSDMPTESAELPAFFDSVENFFKLYEIPAYLRSLPIYLST